MFHRDINIPEKQSFFLFGARGTGKTTLLRQRLNPESTHTINLLLAQEEERYRRNPDSLIALVDGLPAHCTTLIIDEIQKVPRLLDIVHHLIELANTRQRFVLTGSSARKLRHGGANLLAGRAFTRYLFPLTRRELGSSFDLQETLRWGGLPRLYSLENNESKRDFLQAYAHTYLKEEIQLEQLVRRVDAFHRFLEVAAQSNGKLINFTNIGRDTGIDGKTVKSFYEILSDTLLGFMLEPYHSSRRKRLGSAPKFYFFDLGVSRALTRQLLLDPHPGTSYYGDLFEQLVVLEAIRQEQYANRDYRFSFMRTLDDAEVDLVVERPGKSLLLVEIKSTTEVRQDSLRILRGFAEAFPEAECQVWSLDPRVQKFANIRSLPWYQGLAEM
jgi:predicted AAA+ superfamily ATPase